jgi:hypothetical protein
MNADRDVILDLLPLYEAGLASAASRQLVEEWLRDHQEEGLAAAPAAESHGTRHHELDALLRVKRLLRRQRWLFGAAIGLTVLCCGLEINFGDGGPLVHLLALEYPLAFLPVAAGAALLWLLYFRLKARLR